MSNAPLTVQEAAATARGVLDQVEHAVVGKREVLGRLMVGILSGGHVLLEDLPGLGKTLMARSFAQALGLTFTRVQFTPDLLPADLTGASVLTPDGSVDFRPGPVFTQLLLADEINRTPPKTQSALLEAMAERQVTADGETRPLPAPFVVLATDNPVEYEGTYPLPEAQLDRFTLRLRIGYLDQDREVEMVQRRIARQGKPPVVTQVTDADGVLALQQAVEQVEVDADLVDYAVRIVAATREHPHAQVGSSPRGALDLVQTARALALLDGRTFVLPDDVKAMAVATLGHRISVRPEMWLRRIDGDDVVTSVLQEVPVPTTLPTRAAPPTGASWAPQR